MALFFAVPAGTLRVTVDAPEWLVWVVLAVVALAVLGPWVWTHSWLPDDSAPAPRDHGQTLEA